MLGAEPGNTMLPTRWSLGEIVRLGTTLPDVVSQAFVHFVVVEGDHARGITLFDRFASNLGLGDLIASSFTPGTIAA